MFFRFFVATTLFCAFAIPSGYSRVQAQEVDWKTDYTAARSEATKSKKPLLLDFGTEGCMWCRKLDVVFRSSSVAKIIAENFVAVRIDADKESRLADAMRIRSYPTIVIASPDGKVIDSHSGYMDAGELVRILDKARSKAEPLPIGSEAVSVRANAQVDDTDLIRCRVIYQTGGNEPIAKEASETESIDDSSLFGQLIQSSIAEIQVERAKEFFRQGNREQANSCLEKAIRLGGDSAVVQSAREMLEKLK